MDILTLSFVLMERADGMTAFAQVPAWVCESIIPIAFGIISIRYFLFFFNHCTKLVGSHDL